MAKRNHDWEQIEKDFRMGQKTVRCIASEHNISHTAINKKAKLNSWVQDKSKEVIAKTRAALLKQNPSEKIEKSKDEVSEKVSETENIKEVSKEKVSKIPVEVTDEDIEIAVQTNVAVIKSHRASITQGQKIVDLLTSQLLHAAENREALIKEVDGEADENAHVKAAMRRAVKLPSHAVVLRDLSGALKNLVAMERQAFGIDKMDQQTDNPIEDLLNEVAKRAVKLIPE